MATITTNTVRKYKDLDLNFISHPVRKDVNKLLDEDAVIGSIRNLLQTSHYERLFQPSLGSNVKRILFENMDPISESALKREIIQTLTKAVEVGLKKKLIIFIDSLGGLNTAKEIRDAMENSTSGDMGSRAKQLKSMLNKLTYS